ncbi:MAG: hypothetical protein F2829_19990 [Actinobacteria bacterium]|nr:hypothetical protein [Actinomycetota bacterium]
MRARGVGLLLAATLAVAGCSDESTGGEPLPPVSPTVSSAPPASAFPETPQGASDFARYVFEQLDQAYATEDPERVRPLFAAQGCSSCDRFLRTLEALQSGEVQLQGGGFDVVGAESPGGEEGRVVVMRVNFAPSTFVDAAGEVVAQEPGTPGQSLEMQLETSADGFIVADILFVGEAPQ